MLLAHWQSVAASRTRGVCIRPPHQPIRRSVVEAPRPDMACCHAIEMQIWGVRSPPRVRLPISLFGAREQIRRPVRDRPARATAHVRGGRAASPQYMCMCTARRAAGLLAVYGARDVAAAVQLHHILGRATGALHPSRAARVDGELLGYRSCGRPALGGGLGAARACWGGDRGLRE